MTLDALRAALPATQRYRFLNYAATAPMLEPAARAMEAVAREGLEPMSVHFTAWLAQLESTRRAVAEAIDGSVDGVTFTSGTSAALSLIAGAVRWKPGDRVLYPTDEFSSNRFVWDNLADLGVEVQAVEPERGVGFADQLLRRDLTRVRLVALSAVSYRDGRRHDVRAVVDACHAAGILVAVDAIQAVGAVPVSAREWGCDFLACGGQKWLLGPVGSGFLYVAPERLAELHVPTVGWAGSRHAGDPAAPTLEFCEGAARFEAGLPDLAAIAGLGASLATLAGAGWSAIHARVEELDTRLRAELAARGVTPLHDGPAASRSGIVTIALADEEQAEGLERALERRRVLVTRRGLEFRVASHATTTPEDQDHFLAAWDEARPAMRGAGSPPRRAAPEPVGGTGPDAAGRPTAVDAPWKHALVTGASRGLGEAFAVALARRGVSLTLIGRDLVALRSVAERIARDHGVETRAVALDLADAAAVARWIAAEQATLGALDLVVNNAAWSEAEPFVEARDASLRAGFETNVFAPLALARAALPGMLERGRGGVLNVVTSGARNALPLFSAYSASKAALWAWSESLGRELAGTGVTVTTFLPSHMDTATRRQLGRRALAWYDIGTQSERTEPVSAVAERALAALAEGRRLEAPASVRWTQALNAVAPARVARRIARFWRPARPGR